jgi:heme/copper-type cytochrome/quinol oxidase subunit 3
MCAVRNGTIAMLVTLILSTMFFAGFFLGYATRARRSHKRSANDLMYSPYRSKPSGTTFGHARRAF